MGYYPRTDVSNNEFGMNIEIAIPGLGIEDVHLEFSENNLNVYGRHSERNQYARYTSKELYTGFFSRTYIINSIKFDTTNITSQMINGLLKIHIPYKNTKNLKKITTINIEEVT